MTARTSTAAFLVCALVLVVHAMGASTGVGAPAPLPVYRTAALTPEWVDLDDPAEPVHRVEPFGLTDQRGRTVTEADLDGRVTVVGFFFARCTSICPTLRTSLADVQAAFPRDSGVQILSHTVQPEHDSVEALAAYAAANGVDADRWRLLTGDRDAIYALARRSYFADVAGGGFLHTETLFLVDGQRRIRGVYTGTLPLEVEQLVADARALRAEA